VDLFIDLIRWMYTNELKTKGEKLFELLLLADEYLCTSIMEYILKLLKDQLNTELCCKLLRLNSSGTCKIGSLETAIKDYLYAQFKNLDEEGIEKKFMKLNREAIEIVLFNPNLLVQYESTGNLH
jgi:hypothetical protein